MSGFSVSGGGEAGEGVGVKEGACVAFCDPLSIVGFSVAGAALETGVAISAGTDTEGAWSNAGGEPCRLGAQADKHIIKIKEIA